MFGSSESELVRLLRSRLSDDRHSRLAFTLRLDDSSCRSCVLELVNGWLRTSAINARRAEDLSVDLNSPATSTVRRLLDHLNRRPGYIATADGQYDGDHPAYDLRFEGFGELVGPGVALYHRRFSDTELLDFVTGACKRHNMNYTPATVPDAEHQFVLMLAHAEALRSLATNAVKRRGLTESTTDLIALAASYEQVYNTDRRRQERAVPVPEIQDGEVGTGDIVVGSVFRRSPRTGYMAPAALQTPPDRPEIYPVEEDQCADTTITLRWKRSRAYDFYAMELWRDTREDVRRYVGDAPGRVTTSKLVMQAQGANRTHRYGTLATTNDGGGQLITSYVDGLNETRSGSVAARPLEPETTYYYRLYFLDFNGEVQDSIAVQARTKAMRARLDATTPLDVITGPVAGGTAVTMTGVRFHEGMTVMLGDKPVTDLVIVSPTSATFATPAYFNAAMVGQSVDLVVRSLGTGLEDIAVDAWSYTA